MGKDIISFITNDYFIIFSVITIIIIGMYLYFNYLLKWLLNMTINSSNLTPLTTNELNNDLIKFGFAYNETQDLFYSTLYPWQREYGYGILYDYIAPFFCMIIDSEPIYFKYNNKYYLVELWKGQYGMTTGGEIGLYVSDKNNIDTVYNSVDDNNLILMSYILKKKNKVIITRNDNHWWLTGFKLGMFSKPKDLTMEISLTFKNELMRDAFINGIKEKGYKNINKYNNTVYFTFNKPYSKQPKTKNRLIKWIIQKYNKNNCKLYNKITKDYSNSLDKINYIRSIYPALYKELMNLGKSSIFNSIKSGNLL
ncbi:MAG: DUF4474 domain-containing protein [Bacilli bacterium]